MVKHVQKKIFSLIIHKGISSAELQQILNIKQQSIYNAITNLRKRKIKIIQKNRKYYVIDTGKENQGKCRNELCLHNSSNNKFPLSKWNKTDCVVYETDPYFKDNLNEFKIQECPALKKFIKLGW